ncbi:MAG: hypothetical protein HN742_40995 [Lentisphaerae bacterium]|jgi:hypothetical protein|nr:hypothetical protein [Lentisphaerota bacterium]MBT4820444.1 hypothetical protein [Lentisphaerota bacterium]MBT5609827.1 hypothetical protein [Lentisphaerota bacterium]MBT7059865.1 hypothetical protein [Lentisphaerota bacterium]MBT7848314.1 hypothetical protein [Lentisphaerota bacterium]
MAIRLAFTVLLCILCAHAQPVVEDDTGVALTTTNTVMRLSKTEHGAIASCRGRGDEFELVAADANRELFLLALSKPGDTTGALSWVSSQNAGAVAWAVTGQRVTITFADIAGRGIAATCVVDVTPDTTLWEISLEGGEEAVLERVIYPIVDLRADVETDALAAGLTKGGVFHRPSAWKKGMTLTADQPGKLCAQFACWYASSGGMYSASRDPRGYPKVVQFRREENSLRLSWQRRAFHPLGSLFEQGYPIELRTFGSARSEVTTDWRDAADIYKRWALQQAWCRTPYHQRTDIPAWLRSAPAMIRFSRHWLGSPERVESWLNDYWKVHFPDTPLIVALWGWEQHGSWLSPDYFPPYPSEEGFARIVAAIKAVDGHAFPWPSGYYWNVEYNKQEDDSFEWQDWDGFRKTGEPHALLNRDGKPLIRKLRWLRGGRNAVLCRGDAWTRQWFTANCVELMKRGCDMVQVDQVVGAAAPGRANCFATHHGHPVGPGVWDTEAFTEQLVQLGKQCRRIQPDAVLSIEEPQEYFNHLIEVQDYRDAQIVWKPEKPGHVPDSVFGYLYHEFLPVFQSNPRAGNLRNLAHCIVTGQIPHWVPHWPITPAPMLANGAFDVWSDGVPDGWQKVKGWQGKTYDGKASQDDAVSHGTGPALRLENAGTDDIVQVSQNVSVGPRQLVVGRTYRLSCRAKVDRLDHADAGVLIAALRHGLSSCGSWRLPYGPPGDWRKQAVEFTIPEKTDFLRVMIHVTGECRLWIDELQLEERDEDGWRTVTHSGLPSEHDLVKRWVELFHGEGRPYLLFGRMLHPPRQFEPSVPMDPNKRDVFVNAFRSPDGSEVAVAVNASAVPQPTRLEWQGREHVFTLEASEIRLIKASR